jgi:hypothetical protein
MPFVPSFAVDPSAEYLRLPFASMNSRGVVSASSSAENTLSDPERRRALKLTSVTCESSS